MLRALVDLLRWTEALLHLMGRGTLKPRDDLVNISLGRAYVFLGLGPRSHLRGRGNRALAFFPRCGGTGNNVLLPS